MDQFLLVSSYPDMKSVKLLANQSTQTSNLPNNCNPQTNYKSQKRKKENKKVEGTSEKHRSRRESMKLNTRNSRWMSRRERMHQIERDWRGRCTRLKRLSVEARWRLQFSASYINPWNLRGLCKQVWGGHAGYITPLKRIPVSSKRWTRTISLCKLVQTWLVPRNKRHPSVQLIYQFSTFLVHD